MKRKFATSSAIALACALGVGLLTAGPAAAQDAIVPPGDTVAERAINGARMYMEREGLETLELNMLAISLFRNALPDFLGPWEEKTGIKINMSLLGYTEIPSKIMAEAVSRSAAFDIFNDFPYTMPDAVGAQVIMPLDEFAERGKPDLTGIPPGILYQQYYKGQLYNLFLDGDHLILVLRKDIVENPQVVAEYRERFGKDPGCPATLDEWEQMAEYFHTEEGETRWGITFDKPMYGAMGYRAIDFSYRHFPAYFGGLLFDEEMNPQINTPEGHEAIRKFVSINKWMPEDIQGWGTPQIYPFWGAGRAFSVMAFPSIVAYANSNPDSTVKHQQISCQFPQTEWKGELVRNVPQAAGTGYMINAYSRHPEAAYWFIQWLTSPSVGNEAIAHPQGFWDPYREANVTHQGIIDRFGQEFLDVHMKNAEDAVALLLIEGNYEYFKILDVNLADVMAGNISAEEAARRIESGWNRVTEDIGRENQIEAWNFGVNSGLYGARFAM